MKPLLAKDLGGFLQRFENFQDAELRNIEVLSPTTLKVTVAAQDSAREFDWVSIELEFNDVEDAKLLDTAKLSFVDMSEGITLIYENKKFAFGITNSYNITNIRDAQCYIISSNLKYHEGNF